MGNDLQHVGRNLKRISEYKLNEKYVEQNVKQQAGFLGELIDEARKNKKFIRAGKSERVRNSIINRKWCAHKRSDEH